MTVKELIADVVSELVVPETVADTFVFATGTQRELSKELEDSVPPIIFLEVPIQVQPEIMSMGGYEEMYFLAVFFLFKTEIDNGSAQINEALELARRSMRDFVIAMHKRKPKEIKYIKYGKAFEIPDHIWDIGLSGIMLPIEMKPNGNNSSC